MIEFQFQVCRNQRSISQISVKGNGGAGFALSRPSLFQNNKHSRFHLPFSHNSNPLPSKRFSPATHFPNSLSQFQKLLKVFFSEQLFWIPGWAGGPGLHGIRDSVPFFEMVAAVAGPGCRGKGQWPGPAEPESSHRSRGQTPGDTGPAGESKREKCRSETWRAREGSRRLFLQHLT